MNGFEAITKLESHLPDLILLDWMMVGIVSKVLMKKPGMSGIEVCKVIRARYGVHIPIIMVSARNQDGTTEEGKRAGCNSFISKPFSRVGVLPLFVIQLGCANNASFDSFKRNK